MIISDEHRYLFLEQPHTASSAIHAELCEHYAGRPLLFKHATYADFLRVATPEQKRYFVFSAIRNPLDEAVSVYFKYRTDHNRRYTSKPNVGERRREVFQYVTGSQADFTAFLHRYYRRPWDNDTLIAHGRLGYVIRFERLQDDFAAVLGRLGLEQVRPLPVVNRTSERRHFLEYYPPDLQGHAIRVFGPFMSKWGYEIPHDWQERHVPLRSRIAFRTLGIGRFIYRRFLRRQSHPLARALAWTIDVVRPLGYRVLRW